MYLLTLGLDSLILNPDSVVAGRNRAYGEIVTHYSVILPAQATTVLSLSNSTTVYAFGGSHKVIKLWKMYRQAAVLIKEGKCDVISSQDTYFLGLISAFLARRYHCGLEVQVLGIEKLNPIRKLISKYVLQSAGSIRVLSVGLKRRLIEEFGIKEDRMRLVPIYVDVSALGFNPDHLTAEEKQKIEEEKTAFIKAYQHRFNIVSVNRLVPIKNITMQLQAVAALSKKFPHVLLHIVGDGPLKESLEKEIAQLHIQNNVILHGYKAGASLSPFFTQSQCFVLTSDFEGYGMVVVEAATAGLPIVMTNVGCAGEVIVNEKSGIIVPPKDVDCFINGVTRVIEDEALRLRLKNGAKQSIAELPSFDTVLKMYKASWEQAFNNKK